jgi:hypothetical protein
MFGEGKQGEEECCKVNKVILSFNRKKLSVMLSLSKHDSKQYPRITILWAQGDIVLIMI